MSQCRDGFANTTRWCRWAFHSSERGSSCWTHRPDSRHCRLSKSQYPSKHQNQYPRSRTWSRLKAVVLPSRMMSGSHDVCGLSGSAALTNPGTDGRASPHCRARFDAHQVQCMLTKREKKKLSPLPLFKQTARKFFFRVKLLIFFPSAVVFDQDNRPSKTDEAGLLSQSVSTLLCYLIAFHLTRYICRLCMIIFPINSQFPR